MRKVKIGGTLGPSCESSTVLEAMLEAGLDVARVNFSHGSEEDCRPRIVTLRRAARRAGRRVCVLGDLQGPRLRVGRFHTGFVDLEEGATVLLVAGSRATRPGVIPVPDVAPLLACRRGHWIHLDEGRIVFEVVRRSAEGLRCRVRRGGRLADRKGINFKGSGRGIPFLTPKDRRDLAGAARLGVDWLAVSFVRHAEDLRTVRRLLARAGSTARVMAKIERPEAVDRLDEILEAADGVLVARGDLGVEFPIERVPFLQKRIVAAARAAGRPVMVATHLLESMRRAPVPTRAEASDVVNAALDGSDGLLLTDETASGEYPVEAVATLARILEEVEEARFDRDFPPGPGKLDAPDALALEACQKASQVGARVIVTRSGSVALPLALARLRPEVPIVALSPRTWVVRSLGLVWGIDARRITASATAQSVDRILLDSGAARRGETWVGVDEAPPRVAIRRVGLAD